MDIIFLLYLESDLRSIKSHWAFFENRKVLLLQAFHFCKARCCEKKEKFNATLHLSVKHMGEGIPKIGQCSVAALFRPVSSVMLALPLCLSLHIQQLQRGNWHYFNPSYEWGQVLVGYWIFFQYPPGQCSYEMLRSRCG